VLVALLFLPLVFCFIVSFFNVLLFEKISRYFNFFDRPDGNLKTHGTPVPYLGGMAIFFAICTVLALSIVVGLENLQPLLVFLLVVTPFFLVGFLDDIFVFSPSIKMFLQFLAAMFLLYWLGGFLFSLIQIACLLFFTLAVVNSFNLVDVSDALLSSICLPIFIFFWVYGVFFNLFFLSILAQVLIGSLLGFLFFNWPPARIYLGDAGSLLLAGTTLYLILTSFSTSILLPRMAFLLVFLLGVPLAELCGLIVIRTCLGLPIYMGSPHHFSIYLKKQGLSTAQVALFAGTASTFLALISAFVLYLAVPLPPIFCFLGFMLGLWCYLIYHPSKPLARVLVFLKS
jgi:UDP-N-acetylmuramyl pentapeptide phosphotransferase/UDP-N-acetylglucosamine-1-phosphate transferase